MNEEFGYIRAKTKIQKLNNEDSEVRNLLNKHFTESSGSDFALNESKDSSEEFKDIVILDKPSMAQFQEPESQSRMSVVALPIRNSDSKD